MGFKKRLPPKHVFAPVSDSNGAFQVAQFTRSQAEWEPMAEWGVFPTFDAALSLAVFHNSLANHERRETVETLESVARAWFAAEEDFVQALLKLNLYPGGKGPFPLGGSSALVPKGKPLPLDQLTPEQLQAWEMYEAAHARLEEVDKAIEAIAGKVPRQAAKTR